ncbi:RNA polymerase sigma factor [Paracoccus yeei]|uniref:RNA polymerase sigma factor n=1 Tax=Paracoccus yeei TaxID=147645 RepID=UPI00174C5672|nr:sigma-70 family RNA polymerase sigma factor [Paracoccus yeei]
MTELFLAEGPALQRRVARIVGQEDSADVMQEGFLRLWSRAADRLALHPAYLAQCLRNASIDWLRRERRQQALRRDILPEQMACPPVEAPQAVIATDELRRLNAAIRAMPQQQRLVFLLNRRHGCTYREIAKATGLSDSTVEREIARALRACHGALD